MTDKTMATQEEIFKLFYQKSIATGDKLSPKTVKEYEKQYKTISKKINILDDEDKIMTFLDEIENPNTKSNKAFLILKIRRAFDQPYKQIEDMREQLKEEITRRRKMKSKEYTKSLISYTELVDELEKLKGSGLPYIFNYMHVNHGLRNRDLNAIIKFKKPKKVTENTIVFNPKQRKKQLDFYITDYKTSATHGDKHIIIKDENLLNEMKKLNRADNTYLVPVKQGQKATDGYINVLASKFSIRGLGEAKIAKILMKHFIDTKQFNKVHELSEQRGTNLSTLYTSYNMYDNIHKKDLQHQMLKKELMEKTSAEK